MSGPGRCAAILVSGALQVLLLSAQERPLGELDVVGASLMLDTASGPPDSAAVYVVAKSGGALGVRSLLRVLDRLGPEDRRTVAAAYPDFEARHEPVIELLERLARDPDSQVRRAAIGTLGRSRSTRAGRALLPLLASGGRPEEGEALASAVRKIVEGRETAEADKGFDAEACRTLEPLAGDAEVVVRREALGALAALTCPEASQALLRAAFDPDPQVSRIAKRVLDRVAREARPPGPSEEATPVRALLLWTTTLSAILGLLLFLWAFRLLKLRALLEGMGVSKARSAAVGAAALSGEAQPRGEYLKHPFTGELCLWYRGAEKRHPGHRFYLEDETGRVLVDPNGAVLLSEDGFVSPAERIHLVGKARPAAGPSGRLLLSIGRVAEPRGFFRRSFDLLIGAPLLGGGAARRLFDDPQEVFWIWDDARKRPLSSPTEVALVFGVALLAGAWMVVFFGSTAVLLGWRV